MKHTLRAFSVAILTLVAVAPGMFAQTAEQSRLRTAASSTDAQRLAQLESLLDGLRQELKIPALSVAVLKDQKVLWARGFGYADLENRIPATEHTTYHLASLTKTFASTIVMQLVQEGKVKLDDPVSKYGIALESEGVVRVRHLLSHTSEGNPGERYRYNGSRFGELDKVIEKATGKSFAELLMANILDPLAMSETAPNVPSVVKTRSPEGADRATEEEVKAAVMNLIAAYNSGKADEIEKYIAPQLNGFRPEGGFLAEFVSAAELRKAFGSGLRLDYQIHDLEAAVYGDTALTTGFITGTATPPNGSSRREGPWRTSFVWHKRGGAWRLVHAHQSALNTSLVTEARRRRFDAVAKLLAQPYALDSAFEIEKIKYPTAFATSAGLISSVLDMAKYDIAVDQNRFLTRETQQLAFTPTVSTKGETLPYGMGWFTQNFKSTKMIWHYGYWTANSSLILKLPERNLTFIALANTDNLSRPTDLGNGDVLSSPVGLAFLKTFLFPEMFGEPVTEINWKAADRELQEQLKRVAGKPYADIIDRELLVRARMNTSVGRASEASRLFKVYQTVNLKSLPADLSKGRVIAQIKEVADDQNLTTVFTLPREQSVRVFALGEAQDGQTYDYGWIENAATGQTVWEMKEPQTTHAGGARRNRLVDVVVKLPSGSYRLHYKSDDSHSFDHWVVLPPHLNFWGIALYTNEE